MIKLKKNQIKTTEEQIDRRRLDLGNKQICI